MFYFVYFPNQDLGLQLLSLVPLYAHFHVQILVGSEVHYAPTLPHTRKQFYARGNAYTPGQHFSQPPSMCKCGRYIPVLDAYILGTGVLHHIGFCHA